eukprot:443323-Rhodomonas_salina.1
MSLDDWACCGYQQRCWDAPVLGSASMNEDWVAKDFGRVAGACAGDVEVGGWACESAQPQAASIEEKLSGTKLPAG